MRKIIIIAALTISLFGCNPDHKLIKPFVIIDKTYDGANDRIIVFTYQDSTGYRKSFHDKPNAYKIGDVIN